MSTIAERLTEIETELGRVRGTVARLRREVETVAETPPAPEPVPAPPEPPEPPRWRPPSPARPPFPVTMPTRDAKSDDRPLLDLVGPRFLAWAGGAAMLAGIVFVFVLTVHRGWVNAELRLLLGAAVSMGLVGIGMWLHRRDSAIAATAAAAAGFGGMFVTLFATTSLYDFLDDRVGTALAELVGAAAVAVAVRWKAQIIAGLGLVGAIGGTWVLHDGDALLMATFFAVAFAAFARVGVTMRWRTTLVLGAVLVLPHMLDVALTGGDTYSVWTIVLIVGGFALSLLETAARWQADHTGPRGISAFLLLASVGVTSAIALVLLPDHGMFTHREGLALAAAALPYLTAGVWLWLKDSRLPASVVSSVGLAFLAGGLVRLFGDVSQVFAPAAVSIGLTWLGAKLRQRRITVAAACYLGLTVATALVVAPLWNLLDAARATDVNVVALLPVVVATAALVRWQNLADDRRAAIWATGGAACATISASIIQIALVFGDGEGAFQAGHTAMSLVWAGGGLALLSLGLRRAEVSIKRVGVLLLCLSLGKILFFDLANLEAMARAFSFLVVGGALLAAATLVSRSPYPARDRTAA